RARGELATTKPKHRSTKSDRRFQGHWNHRNARQSPIERAQGRIEPKPNVGERKSNFAHGGQGRRESKQGRRETTKAKGGEAPPSFDVKREHRARRQRRPGLRPRLNE